MSIYQNFAPCLQELGYNTTPVRGKRPILSGWESRPDKAREYGSYSNATGIGVVCGGAHNIVAVDIDVRDESVVNLIKELAFESFGHAPERIGNAPKILLVYKCATSVRKVKTGVYDLKGQKAEVEILAEGQQFVASGIHPDTGLKYKWPNDSLIEVSVDDLTEITEDQITEFVTQCERILATYGALKSKARTQAKPKAKPLIATSEHIAPFFKVRAAFAYIPNNDSHYDDWVQTAHAIKGAVGDDGYELFCQWSAESEKNDDGQNERLWKSIGEVTKIGAGSIFHWASENGFDPATWDRENNHNQTSSDTNKPWIPFKLESDGVYRQVEKKNKSTGEKRYEWEWFCSPLEVAAETRDVDGENWGRLLIVTDRDHAEHEWALPMELLAGSGEEYRKRLFSTGLIMSPGLSPRGSLHEYLSTARPTEKARCVNRIGWQNQTFVLPDETFGNTGGERVLLQTVHTLDHAFRVSGSVEDWQQNVARYAVGNSRLAFSLSAAFAAPLLGPCDAESGGFHFRGASSIGKSTAMIVAGSAWGGGTVKGYARTWRATDNGLEAVAQTHCDALLCLDEMSQVDGKAAGAAAYMLANGAGKSRAGRSGEGRKPAEWRVLFLSNGEISLSDKLAEDGRGRKVTAGQEVRVIDMPADAGVGLGAFENIHGFDSPDAFAQNIKRMSCEYYGAPIRAYLPMITADLETVRQSVAGFKGEFIATHCPRSADGQVFRVAERFGLVAAGGELAIALGILPWERGEASRAAAVCFQAWIDGRGGVQPTEIVNGIAQVRQFIELHGESRFTSWSNGEPDYGVPISSSTEDRPTFNRAGFRRENSNGEIEYYVLQEAWKSEICAGFDPGMIARALVDRDLLIRGKDGKTQSSHRLPGFNKVIRCYRLSAAILGGDNG
jgi:uncharacterized protein (DUF927 family)